MPPMIRALAAGVILSSAGCAQLAGIDSTSGTGRAADTLALQRVSIGATVSSADLDLTGLTASYLVAGDGGTQIVAADSPAPGMWHADLADPAPVEFTLPDVPTPIPRIFAFPDRAMAAAYVSLEHPGRTPVPAASMITLNVPLDVPTTATDGFEILTAGSWTVRGFAATELPPIGTAAIGPVTYDFTTSLSLSGRPLDKLTSQDAFFVLRYAGALLTGVATATPFEQTGADMVTTATMAPVTANQMLNLKVDPPSIMTRYQAVRPAVAGLAMSWSASAAPGYAYASNTGPALQSGTVAMTDVGITSMYGNPFTGRMWNTIVTFVTSETRTYTPAGTTTPATLVAGMNQFIEPSVGAMLDLPAGLPLSITLGGMPLVTDGTPVAKPTDFVQVTFQTDKQMATLYNLQVFDLLPNAMTPPTALEGHLVLSAAGSEPMFSVPPEIFQVGHSYTLRAFATTGGYPAMASGNFQMRALPLAQSYFDSAVIVVTP
jgi:hypothetical protein